MLEMVGLQNVIFTNILDTSSPPLNIFIYKAVGSNTPGTECKQCLQSIPYHRLLLSMIPGDRPSGGHEPSRLCGGVSQRGH